MTHAETTARPGPPASRPVRLETLVRLRWLAVAGQAAAVLFVDFWLGYPLPLWPCIALIGLSAALNAALMLRFGASHRPGTRLATAQLAYDSLQLGGLLYLTGGLLNPFSLLLLAPVSVSAATLPMRLTVLIAGLVALIATVLALVHLPLPWEPGVELPFSPVYVLGIWISLLSGVVFITAYTHQVAHEARQLADALTATELAVSRQQQLTALDGLAAAAAHELGTPLSTIALAAKEMRAELEDGPAVEDADLILEQIGRCRAILARLRNLGAESGDPFPVVRLGDIVAEAAKPYEASGPAIRFSRGAVEGGEPQIRRSIGLLYGLGNLIENAVQFARSEVSVETGWDRDSIAVTIADDGPGFPPEHLVRLGEPYFTTRARERAGGDEARTGGMGLGIFIAKTLLERTGARLIFGNREAGRSAYVHIVWPRSALAVEEPAAARSRGGHDAFLTSRGRDPI